MEIQANQGNEAAIEGLLDPRDRDDDGFIKITAGITSSSGWYIRVRASDIISATTPEVNSDYDFLGPLQVIRLKRDGEFKARGNNTVFGLEVFFANIANVKAQTVSPTTTYKRLGA